MTTTSEQRRRHLARAVRRTVATVAFAALTLAFLLEPEWVEGVSTIEPDGGSGAFELALAGLAGLATLVTSWGATRSWRHVLATEA